MKGIGLAIGKFLAIVSWFNGLKVGFEVFIEDNQYALDIYFAFLVLRLGWGVEYEQQ